jgi:hypothetical protein
VNKQPNDSYEAPDVQLVDAEDYPTVTSAGAQSDDN